MPFDETNRGDPFGGDFPGRPGHEAWEELEASVQRQVDELAQRRHEPATRHRILRELQERRQQQEADARQPEPLADNRTDDEITQFDFLPVEVGFDTLLKRGELLITGQSYDGRHAPIGTRGQARYAKGYLDAIGMQASEVDCAALHGRVLRLAPRRHMEPQELADVARDLRTRGFTVSVTNITPMGYVGKATGGPQPPPPPPPPPPPLEPAEAAARRPGPVAPARVAVIDTGIASEIRTDGRLDDVPRDDNIDPLDRFPYPSGDGALDFAAGHGTFVAGIVEQVAPGADITVYRAVDSDGIASEVTVACEMIKAVTEGGAQIVNLSLGCQTLDNLPPIAIKAALEIIREWERVHGEHALIVAAAGNYADTRPCWPAAFRRVVSVAGLAPDMLPARWSSHGHWVTCSTIGQGLLSTFVEGRESPLVDPGEHTFGPDAWAVWSGTSFAAPQITGALARLYQHEGISLRDALRRLLAAGRPIPDFGQALRILPGL